MSFSFGVRGMARLSLMAGLVASTFGAQAQTTAQTAAQPSAAEAQYRLGLYQRETGQPYSAIDTLESLLSAEPGLNRARLELAVAYYRTLNYERARAQAQRVLDDPRTPENVRLSVLSFVKQIELEERTVLGKPHRLDLSASVGLLYDSNVNAGPDNAVLGVTGSGLLTLNSAFLSKSDWGQTAQVGLRHTWQRPEPVRVGEQAGRLQWNTSLSGYQKNYQRENDFNLGVVTLATGPGLILGDGFRGNINLQLDHISFGGRDLGLYTSVTPSMTWRALGGELTTDVQVSQRNFSRPTDAGRQGQFRSLGVSYGRILMGQLAVQGGARSFVENTREDRFSNRGDELFLGGRLKWSGLDFFLRTAWRNTRFAGVEPIFGIARQEVERRNELGVSYALGSASEWLLSGTVANVHNKANISLYGYNRDTVTITLSRSF